VSVYEATWMCCRAGLVMPGRTAYSKVLHCPAASGEFTRANMPFHSRLVGQLSFRSTEFWHPPAPASPPNRRRIEDLRSSLYPSGVSGDLPLTGQQMSPLGVSRPCGLLPIRVSARLFPRRRILRPGLVVRASRQDAFDLPASEIVQANAKREESDCAAGRMF
jgi:hypothetical protein